MKTKINNLIFINKIVFSLLITLFFIFLISLSSFGVEKDSLNLEINKNFEDKEYIEQEVNFITTIESLTKYSQSILKSSATISVIQPLELKFFYYPDLKTLFNFSPGLYVVEDGQAWYLGNKGIQIPGSVNSRSLILLNGYRTNDYNFGYSTDYPVRFINSIEIVHGYSNVYFGSNSLLATINIIPNYKYYLSDYSKEQNFNFYSFVNFNEDKINTINGFMFNKKIGNYYLSVGADFFNYKGRKIFFNERQVVYGGSIDDPINTSFYKDRTWKYYEYLALYNENEQIYFANYANRYNYPTGPGGFEMNSPLSYGIDKTRLFYYQRKFQLSSNIQLNTKIYYNKYSNDGELPYEGLSAINVDKNVAEVVSFENNLNIRSKKYDLLLGLDVQRILSKVRNFDANYSFIPSERYNISGFYSNVSNNFFVYSLYFHMDYYLKDDLILALGGRFDNYSNIYKDKRYFYDSPLFGTNEFVIQNVNVSNYFIPKFGIIKVLPNNSSIKLIYSSNIRFPSFFEVYRNAYWNAYVTEPLVIFPEKHRTIELVYYKEKLYKNKKSYFTFSLYDTKIKDLIYEDPTSTVFGFTIIGYSSLANLKDVGVFMDYVYQVDDKSFFRFSASYSNVRISNFVQSLGNLEYMPNSPKLITLVKYGYKFKNNLSIALEAKYTSQTLIDDPRRLITTGFVPLFPVPDTFKIKPYVLANLTVNYFIDKNSYITLYVNNLFNENFYYPVSYSLNAPVTKYPGYKRNLYLGITYSF
jgi:outer membrane receptor protein involved in Fe transport